MEYRGGLEEDYRVQRTEYRGEESVNAKVQIGLRPVERWKSEYKTGRGGAG